MGEINIGKIHNVHKKYRQMNLVNPYRFSTGGFVSTWKTDNLSTGSSASTQVKLPLISTGTYNFIVDWGDSSTSTITVWNQAQSTHTYASSGTYTIKITGVCTGWQFNNTGDRLKLLSISRWGILRLGTNQNNYFYGCTNLNLSGLSDILDLTGTTSLSYCFRGCTTITSIGKINEWNTSNVTDMTGVFYSSNFNQNIGAWNVSSSSSFLEMFFGTPFNNGGSSTINNWALKTTGTISMFAMFQNATAFNQPIGNWNTSAVTSMNRMFNGATAFNQNIGGWNVSAVSDMSIMFWSATAFNQNIGSWNVSAVTNINSMFRSATAFNQNIGSWNVSAVSDFTNFMFAKTAANFSAANLDSIYNGWSSRPVLASKNINFGTAKYTAASSAGRSILTGAPNNWVITDGGI